MSEEGHRTVFDAMGAATIVVGEDGKISLANKGFEDLSGHRREEIEGKKSWKEFFAEGELEGVKEYRRLRLGGSDSAPGNCRTRFVDREGNVKVVILNISPIPKTEKFVASILEASETVGEAGEAGRGEKAFEELFEEANEMIITTDPEGIISRVNRRVEEISGYSREELKGENLLKLAHHEDREKYTEFRDRILAGEELIYELRGLTREGETFHFSAAGTAIRRNGEAMGIQYNARDITERKRAEDREEFLHSLLRHDVRNKAQIAHGYLELLQDSDLTEDQGKFVGKAMRATKEGFELIEKVRTLRGVETEGEVGKVDLESVLDRVVEENEDWAEEEGMEIDYERVEVGVRGGSFLKELFSNLVENSILHSDGGTIKISTRRADDEVSATIEDDGEGIPKEERGKIFERGFKGGERGGSGLGLYLVDRIAENYGGRVEVSDSDLGGARFDVNLKRA